MRANVREMRPPSVRQTRVRAGRCASTGAVGAVRRLPCDARSRGLPHNSLRSLRSLRSNRCGKSEVEARCARGREPCASRRSRGAPRPARTRLCTSAGFLRRNETSRCSRQAVPVGGACSVSRPRRRTRCVRCALSAQTPATSQSWMRAARADRSPALLAATDSAPDGHRLPRATAGLVAAKKTGAGAKARSGRSRSASGAPRSAGLAARARSALPPLTRRRCLSVESAANAASSATGPRDRASQGSRRAAPTAPAKRSGLPGRDFAARTVELHLFFFIVMAALERAPQQDRNDQREDDHFLEGAGVVRAEAFEQADEHGADRRARVAGEAAEDRGDESLETDQETGVVEDRGRRADQQTRERADEGRQGEAELAGAGGG